ncbi:AAA family ATPase, partial [Shigella flexneri]
MALFQRAINTQAYLKAGIMGFAGDGKTYTASELAIGLVMLMRQRGIEAGNRPVMFLDTETGSDWVKPRFDAENIELFTAKTRSFVDLLEAINEAESSGSVMIIDSISHFWTG